MRTCMPGTGRGECESCLLALLWELPAHVRGRGIGDIGHSALAGQLMGSETLNGLIRYPIMTLAWQEERHRD